MGFFDKFRKQDKNNTIVETNARAPQARNANEIEYSCTEDGRLVVELYERHPKPGQFYDTTKLIVDNRMVNVEGNYVQNCMVAWYGEYDCVYLGSDGEDIGRRGKFTNVLADIDLDLLLKDESYCLAVMKMLLNQNRVEEYLNRGLQDTPDIPCGKYVGGIEQRDNGYGKMFKRNIGRASHNSPEMVAKRQAHKEQLRQSQDNARATKIAQIEKLKQELDNMGR